MPVQKYQNIDKVGPPPVSDSPTENIRAACELAHLCRQLSPWPVHRGVRRHRAVDAPPEPPAPR